MKRVQLIIVMILAAAANSFAVEDSDAILDKISPAWERLDTLTQSYLSDEQQKRVQQLAFAAAAADICDGFEVDKEKFIKAFEDFDGEKQKTLPDEEQKLWKDKLLVAYGIATGLFAAEGMLVNDQFCSAAEDLRTASTGHYWKKDQ